VPSGRTLSALGILLLASPLGAAEDVKVAPGTVEDQRYSEPRMGGLTIELKLSGAAVGDVKALRPRVKSAKDNLGSSLKAKEDRPSDFEEFSPDRRPGPHVSLSTPGREASTVDVSGDVELFIPSRDPNTKQRFDGFLARLDKPVTSSALKGAKVEITPLSAGAYKARQQQNRPTKDQIVEEGKKHGASDAEIQQAVALIGALAALGGEEPTDTSVLLETKDPDGRIISVDVVGKDGGELRAPSRGSSGGNEDKLVKIDLAEKPPPDAVLLVTLRTSKSIVSVPLNFKQLALP
jgi:hypothetical protein